MKKLSVIITFILFSTFSYAQTVTHDTVYNRHSRYHFTEWYDECPSFEQGGLFQFSEKAMISHFNNRHMWSFYQYTDHPIDIYGISCLVGKRSWSPQDDFPAFYHDTLPEYVYLFQKKTPDSLYYDLILLDSIRWDTANYKILRIPASIDSNEDGMLECHLYEAYFKSPIRVDSVFYIGGTSNNNIFDTIPENNNNYTYLNPRTYYAYLMGGYRIDHYDLHQCWLNQVLRYHYGPQYLHSEDMWYGDQVLYSPYLPIINSRRILVQSADSTMGLGYPSGDKPIGPGLIIYAEANEGYRFSHWNDGDTNNPRVISLTQDTVFTAYFEELERFMVNTGVNNEDWGEVYGAGTYYSGAEAILTASPNYGYRFESWNDGDTLNPRHITVISDTTLTAVIQPEQVGIENVALPTLTLSPNPASGQVTITCSHPMDRISVYAQNGKRMLRMRHCQTEQTLDLSPLPSGSYIVEVRTPTGTISKKLIIGK